VEIECGLGLAACRFLLGHIDRDFKMKLDSLFFAALAPVLSLAFPVNGSVPVAGCGHCEEGGEAGGQIGLSDEQAVERFAEAMFPLLPVGEQAKIVAAQGMGVDGFDEAVSPYVGEGLAREWVEETLGLFGEGALDERRVEIVREIADSIDAGTEMPALCFAPETDEKYSWMVNQIIYGGANAFQQIDRWERTALSGPGLVQGQPTVITYSYVADGTFIPNIGFGAGNSQMFAWLDSVYGSTSAWQSLFDQVFAQWSELTGTSYVYEPNDDGSTMFAFTGTPGVRADVRIGAMVLDGNSGVLAFNFFPDNGDMVFDAFDSFYGNTGNNSLRMRNVIGHEAGHGLGMLHVCPANQTKLMEPFVSTAYDGPQLDDILNGHRHYGDPQEPNDLGENATALGNLNIGEQLELVNVSLDDADDRDFYKLTLDSPALVTFTATPDAASYNQGPQTQEGCFSANFDTNYNIVHDLQINLYSSDDLVNPILTAQTTPIGMAEEIEYAASLSGDYYYEVFAVSAQENVQRYRIDVSTTTLLAITAENPTFLNPGLETSFSVTLNPFEQTVEPGTEFLYYRVGAFGSYSSVPLVANKGNEYTATLPPFACDPDASIQYYIEASTIGANGSFTLPFDGANNPFSAFIGSPSAFFADDFEGDLGWTVTGDVSGQLSGEWERGVPAGDGSRGDPAFDGDGSGECYLTGNGGPGSNTDVDGGETILNSPVFDISGVDRPSVSYWRWYDNTGSGTGSGANEDVFKVEVSDDGGVTWYLLEQVGPDSLQSKGGWFFVEFDLIYAMDGNNDFDFATSQLQLRFIANDLINASVIEAGVDGVSVSELLCENPEPVISLPVAPALSINPGEDFIFEVNIDEVVDTIVPGSEKVYYLVANVNGGIGGFLELPLVHNGGNSYTATIPGQDCNPNHDVLPEWVSDVSYYIGVEGELTGLTTYPDLNSESFLGFDIGSPVLVIDENFELDTGWTVSGGAKSPADGMWERGVPLGDGSRGDPTVDGDGSGSCFVTGNTVAGVDSDVDTLTILNSPIFDASGLLSPRMVYYHWYDNTGAGNGQSPGFDVMEVGISYDGGESFETLDTIGPNTAESVGGWLMSDLDLNAFQSATSQMQVRFLLADQGTGSVIEAGIDGVMITGLLCEDVVACPADIAGNPDGSPDGLLNFSDVSAYLTLYAMGDPAADWAGNPDGTPDGVLNFSDVSAFLSALAAGCP